MPRLVIGPAHAPQSSPVSGQISENPGVISCRESSRHDGLAAIEEISASLESELVPWRQRWRLHLAQYGDPTNCAPARPDSQLVLGQVETHTGPRQSMLLAAKFRP